MCPGLWELGNGILTHPSLFHAISRLCLVESVASQMKKPTIGAIPPPRIRSHIGEKYVGYSVFWVAHDIARRKNVKKCLNPIFLQFAVMQLCSYDGLSILKNVIPCLFADFNVLPIPRSQ